MKKDLEILEESEVFSQVPITVRAARLRHARYDDTMSEELVRLRVDRGDSIAAIVHDTQLDVLLLAEQFRYPTIGAGSGWVLELSAGNVDRGEVPEVTLERELLEELGVRATSYEFVATFFLSPGISSERIHLYYVPIDKDALEESGGGVPREGEDIRVVRLPVSDAAGAIQDGRIIDAKTIIGLQWLLLRQRQ